LLSEKLQTLESSLQSVSNRNVELSQSLESEKQSRANEKAIVLEELANASQQLAIVKANADKAQANAVANAVANAEKAYTPLLKLADAVVGYSNCASATATQARRDALGADRVEELKNEREAHKAVVDAFVESFNAKAATA
jgi:hypothetical protein